MSVKLSIKTLARKIMNCTEEQLIKRRTSGNYKENKRITTIRNQVMANLEIFGDCAQVVKENVSAIQMFNAVKRLLQTDISETIIYEFPTKRSSKSGLKYFFQKIPIVIRKSCYSY